MVKFARLNVQVLLRDFGLLLFLGILLFFAFGSLNNKYAFDDIPIVRDNAQVQKGASAKDLICSTYWNPDDFPERGLYRPVTMLSFWLVRQMTERAAYWDHLLNLLLHFFNMILMISTLRALNLRDGWMTLAASLLFLHPVNTEVVSSITGRSDLLALFFALLSIRISLTTWKARIQVLLILTLSFLSFASKESGLLLGLILLFVLAWKNQIDLRKPMNWPVLMPKVLPVFLSMFIFLALRFYVTNQIGVASDGHGLPGNYLEARWHALSFFSLYPQKLVFPFPLVADYSSGWISLGSMNATLRALSSVVILLFLFIYFLRIFLKQGFPSLMSLGLLSFILSILPVTSFLLVIGSPFAERFLYFGTPFLSLSIIALVFNDFKSRALRAIGFGAAIFLLSLYTYGSSLNKKNWESNRSLFEHNVSVVPENFHMQMSLASEYLRQGEFRSSISHFQAAQGLQPKSFHAYMGLGSAYYLLDRLQEAESQYRAAYTLAPEDKLGDVFFNLVRTAMAQRKTDKARRWLEMGLEKNPKHPELRQLSELFNESLGW